MSRYYPHTEYAEDQPYSKAILTAHVVDRAFQSGAAIGFTTGVIRSLIRKQALATTILAPTGYGALIGAGLMVPLLPYYMKDKTDIEWKDRSWRLLENEGQKEVDDWTSVGLVGGTIAALRSEAFRQGRSGRWIKVVGGAATGELLGIMGYMAWRYGVHGGKWPQKS